MRVQVFDLRYLFANALVDALEGLDEETLNRLKNTATAEKRLGTVEEVSHLVAFLAEDRSRWVNGDTISASGGVTSY